MTVKRVLSLPGATPQQLEVFLIVAQYHNNFELVSRSTFKGGFCATLLLDREIEKGEMCYFCEVCGITGGALYTIH